MVHDWHFVAGALSVKEGCTEGGTDTLHVPTHLGKVQTWLWQGRFLFNTPFNGFLFLRWVLEVFCQGRKGAQSGG